jgi:hypothetical protein
LFIIRAINRSNNDALIYCRITVGMQRVEFSLKKKVRKIIWNNGQAKANTEEGRAVNAYLKQVGLSGHADQKDADYCRIVEG